MRENRTCGSEGGEAKAFPTPIQRRDGTASVPLASGGDARSALREVWRRRKGGRGRPRSQRRDGTASVPLASGGDVRSAPREVRRGRNGRARTPAIPAARWDRERPARKRR
jgi:hypothetical protein